MGRRPLVQLTMDDGTDAWRPLPGPLLPDVDAELVAFVRWLHDAGYVPGWWGEAEFTIVVAAYHAAWAAR